MTAVGDLIPLTIEKVVHGGRGLGRWHGLPVFVTEVLEGERVDARITALRKGYVEAAVAEVVIPSASRLAPPCTVYSACGGCQLQHATYHAQLDIKRAAVRETLRRLGALDIDVPPVVPSPHPFGYRLRAQLKIGRAARSRVLGFFAAGSHTVVASPLCAVLHSRLQAALAVLSELVARSEPGMDGLRDVELQTTSLTEECVVVLRFRSRRSAALDALVRELRTVLPLRGVVAYGPPGRRVYGEDWLEERVEDLTCRVSDRTFLQINAGANAALVATVVAWAALTGRERVVDLYAGFGNFSLPLAAAGRVTAVESAPTAVMDAQWNARSSSRAVRVIGRGVEAWLPKPEDRGPDLVVLDPPRVGLTRAALARVLSLNAARLLYVSCEPATLARDAARFAVAGYRVARVQCFDFFPHTAHVETLAELQRS